jgi:hypothetical protein
MITKTYISKFATIVKDSTINTGLNSVSELIYGANVTRSIIYFDHSKIKEMYEDKTYPDLSKMTHILKITNCGSIDFTQLHSKYGSSINDSIKVRATSFDLIFFLIPQTWDVGKGFDYSMTFFNQGYYAATPCTRKNGSSCGTLSDTSKLVSRDAVNWFQATNSHKWNEPGIYSNKRLSEEYDNWSSEQGSLIVIGRQHFDVGNESISFDVTDVVNKFITGELENYGIGIAFSPQTERTGYEDIRAKYQSKFDEIVNDFVTAVNEITSGDTPLLTGNELKERMVYTGEKKENYIGFFTNHTNTFFEPYLETTYDDAINDDRGNFVLNKLNRLYLYCNVGGNNVNLDTLPTCTIDDKEYEVHQFSKGVYYIELRLTNKEYKPMTMLYDVWSNLYLDGEQLDDIELYFTTKGQNNFFNIGSNPTSYPNFVPTIYGINNDEDIFRKDEIRKVGVLCRKPYTNNENELLDRLYYRVYIKDGTREFTVIPFECVNKTYNENFFLLYCDELIPNTYYIDIKTIYNGEVRTHKDVCHFNIIENLDNKYN